MVDADHGHGGALIVAGMTEELEASAPAIRAIVDAALIAEIMRAND